jgi:hypothetical protein
MKHTFVNAIFLPTCGVLLMASAAEADLTVLESGPHHRVWAGERGSYTELETGMNYFDLRENTWKPSSVEILIHADGASATRGLHNAHFSGNLNEPSSIVWTTPEGAQIKTRFLGLSYYCRATQRSVWIAELKPDVPGVLHPPNRVVYNDAFDNGVLGEVHYVYTKSRFSATVVLLAKLPPPSDWGLDPNTSSLEVVTELFDLPAMEKSTRQVAVGREGQAPMPDEYLKLGSAEIAEGRAFTWDGDSLIPVAKTLTRIEGRDLLFESVDYISAKPELDTLPNFAGMIKAPTIARQGRTVPATRSARAARTAPAKANIQVAAAPFRARGFWIDWEGTLTSGTNDYIFAPNHTTYVSGQVNLSNTNYLMGGTVIKFAPTNNAGLSILGQLICQTGPYEMAVLTARDDHSVGGPVGTNALSGHYAGVAVQLPGYPSSELSYVRFAHAKQAIHYSYSMYGTTHNVNHSQFVNCGVGFYPLNVTVLMRNCLMSRVGTNFLGSGYYPSSVRGEHLTVSESTRLNDNSYLTLYLTNALLANVTNNGAGYSPSSANVRTDSGASVFTVIGAGAHYLPASSSHRGAGTTNINSTLAASLKTLTVDAPVIVTNRYTNTVTFFPQAQRGKAAGEIGYSVGYWYPPIDYCFGGVVVTNATALLTNGVALAGFGEMGMRVENGAALASEGTPLNRNHILRYSAVQEQSTNWGGGSVTTNRLIEGYQDTGGGPTARFRFTDFEGLAGSGYLLYAASSGAVFGTLTIQDCELNSAIARIAGTEGGRLSLKNNLFLGVETSFRNQPEITVYNNLFHRGVADVTKSTSTNAWTFKDNVFDRVSVAQTTSLTHDYNGYITNATGQWLTNSGGHDTFTNTFLYHTGTLGRFYQPTNSIFVNSGSRSVADAGLYWYTCFTNNVPDTNTVDLGYHLIALNGSGQPLDTETESDGLPSYLEDADGDGVHDPGIETNFNSADTDGDGVSDYTEWIQGRDPLASGAGFDSGNLINLRIYTPLK